VADGLFYYRTLRSRFEDHGILVDGLRPRRTCRQHICPSNKRPSSAVPVAVPEGERRRRFGALLCSQQVAAQEGYPCGVPMVMSAAAIATITEACEGATCMITPQQRRRITGMHFSITTGCISFGCSALFLFSLVRLASSGYQLTSVGNQQGLCVPTDCKHYAEPDVTKTAVCIFSFAPLVLFPVSIVIGSIHWVGMQLYIRN
jgi:hypothetical protein